MHTRKDRQIQLIMRIVMAALIVAAVIALDYFLVTTVIPTSKTLSAREYFGITSDDEVGVTAGTSRSETRGRIIDGETYLDLNSVAAYINPSFFYDGNAGVLIITTPDERLEYPINETDAASGDVVLKDGMIYVSQKLVSSVTDCEFVEHSDPSWVHVRTSFAYAAKNAVKNAPVRFSPSIRSRIITTVEKGAEVRTADVDTAGAALDGKHEGWTKVVTEDGFVGYMRDRHLKDPHPVTREHTSEVPSYEKADFEGRINMVFHQTDNQESNAALSSMISGMSGVNVIAPTWYYIDSTSGEVRDVSSASYVETAKKKGLGVWALVNDFDGSIGSPEETAAFLGSYDARKKAISAIVTSAAACGLDGLCLDFELVREGSAAYWLEFVREIRCEAKKQGLIVAACNYVPTYTYYMGRNEQARVLDYLIVMCYDEHSASSEEAGSVASLPFVEKGIDATLLETDSDRLIAAIPFFTRLWTTENGAVTSSSLGMNGGASAVGEFGMELAWDEKTSQHYGHAESDGVKREIWLEDEESISAKMKAISERGLAGVAEWKLGLEDASVWEVISRYLAY